MKIIGKPVKNLYSHLYSDVDEGAYTIGRKSEKAIRRMKRSQETCLYCSTNFQDEEKLYFYMMIGTDESDKSIE